MQKPQAPMVTDIPLSRKRLCSGCQTFVDSNGMHTWEQIQGWQRCKRPKSQGGVNSVGAVKHLDRYLCEDCYNKLKAGISLDQLSLFDND